MDTTSTALVVVTGLSALLQALKDQVKLSPSTLRFVAAIIGALGGGMIGYMDGGATAGSLATNSGLGALVASGTHSLLLHDTPIGDALKAIGKALFKTTPSG